MKPPLFRYAPDYYTDGRGAFLMRIRFADRYIERPVKEMALETFGAPLIVAVLWKGLDRGWGH